MVRKAYLDTHIVAWLYSGDLESISNEAKRVLENHSLYYSPIVRLELQYLYEIKRIKKRPDVILAYLEKMISLEECPISFSRVIEESIKYDFTRDPFDRVIVAQASINSSNLISKDRVIKDNYEHCVS